MSDFDQRMQRALPAEARATDEASEHGKPASSAVAAAGRVAVDRLANGKGTDGAASDMPSLADVQKAKHDLEVAFAMKGPEVMEKIASPLLDAIQKIHRAAPRDGDSHSTEAFVSAFAAQKKAIIAAHPKGGSDHDKDRALTRWYLLWSLLGAFDPNMRV